MLDLSRDFIQIKKVIIFFIVILFSSCLTIDSDLKLNNNGSGTLKVTYSLDKGLKGISTLGSDDDMVPLNLSEEFIQEVIAIRDDISYKNYQISENDLYYVVDVTFEFDSIEGLNAVLPEDNRVVISNSGKDTIFTQVIVRSTNEEISEENMKIFKDIFKNHSFSLKVRTPKNIIKVDNGIELSRREAVYQEKLIDIIGDSNKKEWSIRW